MAFDEREYARRRAKERAQSSWYKLKEGDNCFRILPTPPTKSVKTNFYEYGIHRDVGPKKAVVRCGINPVSGQGECWLCDVKIPSLKKQKLDTRATALAPKSNLLVQVAEVDENGRMTGPFLFTPAKTIGDQLLASIFGSRKRSYVDPQKGFNININRTGTGKLDTKYGIIEPDQDPSEVPEKLLAKLKPFEELKEIPTYSQAKQQAAYTGKDVVEDEEEEKPRSSKRQPVDEDDADEDEAEETEAEDTDEESDDEDSDAEEEAEEEDEPKPKKSAGKKQAGKKPAKQAEEDEEEAESEEDEDADVDEDEAADEDEEEEPAPKKPVKKPEAKKPAGKKTKPAPAEEEDEEEDEPDEDIDLDEIEEESEADEDEEEEPAPKKPVKKPAAAPAGKTGLKPKTRR